MISPRWRATLGLSPTAPHRDRAVDVAACLFIGAVLASLPAERTVAHDHPRLALGSEPAWSTARHDADVATGYRGPRPLPTFVELEIEAFPRPAAEACTDNDHTIDVAPPATISDALLSAVPSTTIRVAPGTYVENPGEPTALTWHVDGICLIGTGDGDVASGDAPLVVLQSAPGQRYGVDLRADRAVLEGFTVRGFEAAIGLWVPEGQTQRGVTIERTRIELRGASRDGIVAYGDNRSVAGQPFTVDGLLVLDVSVDGADVGVSCNAGPCAHWWIERTSVRGRRGAGSSGADTVAIEDGRQVVIVDSLVENADADGIDLKADDAVVMATRVIGVGRNGIKLWRGGDVLDSLVDGSGADAALVGDGPGRYRYAHVLVTHHGGPVDTGYVGWWAYDHPALVDLEIVDSVFVDNASGGLYVPGSARLSLRHNDFADAGAKLLDRAGRVWYTDDLAELEAAGLGWGNLATDPRLCQGWLPGPDSPLLDAAERLPELERDLWGGPRVSGAGPDIGPVERPVDVQDGARSGCPASASKP